MFPSEPGRDHTNMLQCVIDRRCFTLLLDYMFMTQISLPWLKNRAWQKNEYLVHVLLGSYGLLFLIRPYWPLTQLLVQSSLWTTNLYSAWMSTLFQQVLYRYVLSQDRSLFVSEGQLSISTSNRRNQEEQLNLYS